MIPCSQCEDIVSVVDPLNDLCTCLVYFTVEEVCCEGWQGDDCDVCSLECGERRICDPFSENATCVCDAALWSGEDCATRKHNLRILQINTLSQLIFKAYFLFSAVCDCQNGGSCLSPGNCLCTLGWSGETCSVEVHHVYSATRYDGKNAIIISAVIFIIFGNLLLK